MATSLNTQTLHTKLGILSGIGGLLSLIGTSTFFIADDFLKQTKKYITFVSIVIYMAGLIMIVLSIGLYRDEKVIIRTKNISEMILHLKANNIVLDSENDVSSSFVNKPVLLSSLSTLSILVGVLLLLKQFKSLKTTNWLGVLLYSCGWISNAFAASMDTNSFSSVSKKRLVWTLPGSIAIIIGSFLLPWQIEKSFVSGPSLSLSTIGYGLFTIGTIVVF